MRISSVKSMIAWSARRRTGAMLLGAMLVSSCIVGRASAGCGIEITFDNQRSIPVVLDHRQTKVRTFGPGTNPVPIGIWRRFLDNDITIPANSRKTQSASLNQGCSAGPRSFKFFFGSGSEIIKVNKWVVIPVEQRFRVRIRADGSPNG